MEGHIQYGLKKFSIVDFYFIINNIITILLQNL